MYNYLFKQNIYTQTTEIIPPTLFPGFNLFLLKIAISRHRDQSEPSLDTQLMSSGFPSSVLFCLKS